MQKIASYQEDGLNFLTLTVDLGLGGMKIKTHCSLPAEEDRTFNLFLGNHSIQFRGKIVHNGNLPGKQKVAGIQFMGLSRHGRKLLKDYLGTLEDLQ